MIVARTPAELNKAARHPRVLVPTMGALHAGHLALVRQAGAVNGATVVVSIFVNPTQFNDATDFDRYPRDLSTDLDACDRAGADVVFAPSPEQVYPDDERVPVGPLPPVATEPGLEDLFRPGHFEGVCQVVRRLFALVSPRSAVFGEKDWQQLQVIRAMVALDGLETDIIPGATVRERDGLAMSSRNALLAPADRRRAVALHDSLQAARREASPAESESAMRDVLRRAGLTPEYAAVRDAETLLEPRPERPARALVAARVGGVRLLDNVPWDPDDAPPG